jgi:hypothetical protein
VTQGLAIACLLHIPPATNPTITNKTSPHFAEALGGYHGGNQWSDANFAFPQLRRLRGHTLWPPP